MPAVAAGRVPRVEVTDYGLFPCGGASSNRVESRDRRQAQYPRLRVSASPRRRGLFCTALRNSLDYSALVRVKSSLPGTEFVLQPTVDALRAWRRRRTIRVRRLQQDLHRGPSKRGAVATVHVDDLDAPRSPGAGKEADRRSERRRTTRVCGNGDHSHADHAAASVIYQVGEAIGGHLRARSAPNLDAGRYRVSRQGRLDYQ